MNDPSMNVLMKKATNLASVLTILMKYLRFFNRKRKVSQIGRKRQKFQILSKIGKMDRNGQKLKNPTRRRARSTFIAFPCVSIRLV